MLTISKLLVRSPYISFKILAPSLHCIPQYPAPGFWRIHFRPHPVSHKCLSIECTIRCSARLAYIFVLDMSELCLRLSVAESFAWVYPYQDEISRNFFRSFQNVHCLVEVNVTVPLGWRSQKLQCAYTTLSSPRSAGVENQGGLIKEVEEIAEVEAAPLRYVVQVYF